MKHLIDSLKQASDKLIQDKKNYLEEQFQHILQNYKEAKTYSDVSYAMGKAHGMIGAPGYFGEISYEEYRNYVNLSATAQAEAVERISGENK
jgi:hypothetical protein